MPDSLPFTKMQGVGNDFVVLDGRERSAADWPSLAQNLCARHTGIGADGLLVLDHSAIADFAMRMYNPDGTADVCGNGLRCLARYAVEHGVVSSNRVLVETLAGVRTAVINRHDGRMRSITSVTVDMGVPDFRPAAVPISTSQPAIDYPLELTTGGMLSITALSTGSTHSVTFVDGLPGDEEFFRISPLVENHPLFPERTSLMWCSFEAPARVAIRIWERGAGETLGCGTGACAVAAVVLQLGKLARGSEITVASKGGDLFIEADERGNLLMRGPAETVYTGVVSLREQLR